MVPSPEKGSSAYAASIAIPISIKMGLAGSGTSTSGNAHAAMASPPHWPGGCLTRRAATASESCAAEQRPRKPPRSTCGMGSCPCGMRLLPTRRRCFRMSPNSCLPRIPELEGGDAAALLGASSDQSSKPSIGCSITASIRLCRATSCWARACRPTTSRGCRGKFLGPARQSRHFDRGPAPSGLPRSTDLVGLPRHVGLVPKRHGTPRNEGFTNGAAKRDGLGAFLRMPVSHRMHHVPHELTERKTAAHASNCRSSIGKR